jgi:hypothetical protein
LLLTPHLVYVQFGHLIVNTSMLEGAQLAERELEASLSAKQAQLANSKWVARSFKKGARLMGVA